MATDEWHYFEIPARILIEPMLQGPDGAIPLDYKFHMFDGGLEAIQVDIGRFVNHRRALYTPEWTKMDVALHYPLAEEDIPRPKLLPRMIKVAVILSADFDYIRIDLYEVDGRIFLGRRPSCQALVMKNSLRYPMTEFGEIVGKLLSPISLAPHYD